tara:strand:- start:1363 stop:1731 length:369 start_codon:yes stop_codon:yes gene_type:complete
MSSLPNEVTMVLVTRDDLKLSKGKLAAQCSHAAVNCAMKAKRKAARLYERWNNFGARKIVVRADDESHLRQLYAKALEGSLVCDLVKDAGHTEIPPGTVTVLGIGPAPRAAVDAITGDLKLL